MLFVVFGGVMAATCIAVIVAARKDARVANGVAGAKS
jgi:hypothetical protein